MSQVKYKNIRVTEKTWKNLSHLSIELDKSLGETIKMLYDFYVELMTKEREQKKREP